MNGSRRGGLSCWSRLSLGDWLRRDRSWRASRFGSGGGGGPFGGGAFGRGLFGGGLGLGAGSGLALDGLALLLLARGHFNGALAGEALALRQMPSISGTRGHGRWRSSRARRRGGWRKVRGGTPGHGRGHRHIDPTSLGLDDHRLRPSVAEALLHHASADRAGRAWLQGQRGASTCCRSATGTGRLPVVVVFVRHALAWLPSPGAESRPGPLFKHEN